MKRLVAERLHQSQAWIADRRRTGIHRREKDLVSDAAPAPASAAAAAAAPIIQRPPADAEAITQPIPVIHDPVAGPEMTPGPPSVSASTLPDLTGSLPPTSLPGAPRSPEPELLPPPTLPQLEPVAATVSAELPAVVPRRCRKRQHAAAGGFFAVLLLVFFGSAIVHPDKIYSSVDFTQTLPIESVSGQPYTPVNQVLSDPPTQNVPWFIYDAQEIRAGHLPTWNPYNAGGVPQLADDQSAVFSPFSLPFYLFNLQFAFVFSAFLKLFFIAFFTWCFLRRRGLSWGAGLLGGTAMAFAGYQVLWLDLAHIGSVVMLPAGAWAAEVIVQERGRRRRIGIAALALAIASGLLAGHPETGLYAGIALTVTLAVTVFARTVRLRVKIGDLGRCAGAVALGFTLSAVQLLPFLQYTHLSTTYATRTSIVGNSGVPFGAIGMLAFPDAVGNDALGWFSHSYIYGNSYNEGNGDYIGYVTLVLAVIGLAMTWSRRTRSLAWLGAGLLVTGFLSWHVPPVTRAIMSLPGLRLGRLDRAHDIWDWGVTILAALGVDRLVTRAAVWRLPRRWVQSIVILLGSAVGLLVLFEFALRSRRLQNKRPDSLLDVPRNLHLWNEHVAGVISLSAVGVLCVVGVLVLPRRARPVSVVALSVAVFLSTGFLMRGQNTVVPTAYLYPDTAAMRLTTSTTGSDPVLRTGAAGLLPGTNLPYRTMDLQVVDALGVSWYDELFAAVFGVPDPTYYSDGTPNCKVQLQLFGIKWVVGTGKVAIPVGTQLGTSGPTGRDLSKLPVLATSGRFTIFGVPGSTGVASVVGATSRAEDTADAVAQAASCSFNANNTVVLLDTGPGAAAKAPRPITPGGSAVETQFAPGRDVLVSQGHGGELVLRRTWFPGWQATVDGRPVPVDRADAAFMGVRVAAGTHVVDFSYRPAPVRQGLVVSVLSLLGLLGLLFGPLGFCRRLLLRGRSLDRRRKVDVDVIG